MSAQEIATYGGGVIALGVVLWFVRAMLEVYVERQKSTASGEVSLSLQLQRQIEDLHARNTELNDRYHSAMQDALKLATTHGQELMRAVNEVRREHHEAMVRVHAKLEHTQAELEDCRRRHDECDNRVAALEARIAAVANRG